MNFQFHEQVMAPKWRLATELLERGDSPGFAVHQFRYAAVKQLEELLADLVVWRGARPEGPSDDVSDFMFSCAVCRTMFTIGRTLHDASETLEGYRWAHDSCRLLLQAMSTGLPLASADVETIAAAHRKPLHVAPKPDELFEAPSLKLLSGTGLLLEIYLFLASVWSRWSDDNAALRLSEAAKKIVEGSNYRLLSKGKQALLHEAEERCAATHAIRSSEQEAQNAALAEKLNAKRRKKGMEPTSLSTEEALPRSTEEALSTTSLVSPWSSIEWMSWQAPPNGEAARDAVRSGSLENENYRRDLLCKVFTCYAQALKTQSAVQQSAYYCHKSLCEKLSVDNTNISEWMDAALGLADWYLLVMDLSHAEHCLAAVRRLMELHPTAVVDRVTVDYVEVLVLGATLHLREVTWRAHKRDDLSEGRAIAPLFLNPLLPPEELRNAPEQRTAAVDWSEPERLAFPIPGVAPPRREVLVEWGTSRGSEEAMRSLSLLRTAAASCYRTISVDTDCERYLQLLRQESQALISAFSLVRPQRVEYLRERIVVLQTILSCQLNPVAFRNVLRQAEYELGCTFRDVGQLDKDAEESALGEAAAYFEKFVEGLRGEVNAATKAGKTVRDVFEESDFPSYSVGCLQLGMLYLKQKRKSEAAGVFGRLHGFLNGNPSALANYPALREHMQQCSELLDLLGVGLCPDPSAATPPNGSAHPMTEVKTAGRMKAIRPLGGGKK